MTSPTIDDAARTDPFSEELWSELRRVQLAEGRLSLLVYHRDGADQLLLSPESSQVIGRSRLADIQVQDRSLSQQHARLTTGEDAIWIEDLGSTNGTHVNGERTARREIRPGDRVTMGAVAMVLRVRSDLERGPGILEGHDRFMSRLEEEIVRARMFDRQVAVLMVRGLRGEGTHVSRWSDAVFRHLRPFDHAALYLPDCVEVMLPEATGELALEIGKQVVERSRQVTLSCGVALYPVGGASAGELIDLSRARAMAAEGGVSMAARPAELPTPAGAGAPGQAAQASAKMKALYRSAARVARSTLPVLILGETGVGKELLARQIHQDSDRAAAGLFTINCAAIPRHLVESTLFGHERGAFTGADQAHAGIFEAASGGTVFLDEVGDLPLGAQATLLRVLDSKQITPVGSTRERAVDLRVLAATNRDLEQLRRRGEFREDLLYRLNGVILTVPPLRERPEELEHLALRLIRGAASGAERPAPALHPTALALLRTHRWPGNVRELRNVIERAVVLSQDGVIGALDLPRAIRRGGCTGAVTVQPVGEPMCFKDLIRRYEGQLLMDALRACAWNQSEAARRLEMPRRTLVHKMKALGIHRLGYGAGPR